MAKVACKLVSIYVAAREVKPLLRHLQNRGVMDLDTAAENALTGADGANFVHPDTADEAAAYGRALTAAENALKILAERHPEKKGLLASLSAPPAVSGEQFFLKADDRDRLSALAEEILQNDRFIAEQKAEIVRLRLAAEQLAVWSLLDVPLSLESTAATAVFIGTVEGVYTLEALLNRLAESAPDTTPYAEIIATDADGTYLFAVCPTAQQTQLAEALRGMGFARPAQAADTDGLPREKIADLQQRAAECAEKIAGAEAFLAKAAAGRRELEIFADLCRTKADCCRTLGETAQTAHTALVRGYVAEPDYEKLKAEIEDGFCAVVEAEDADAATAPVKLKNNRLFAPAEMITSMYSLPCKQDIDPTPLTGFFYYLLFGMMLSDAGYGLLIVLGTLFVLLKLKPAQKMRQTMKMFLYCGVSTVIWGLIFGSFFGDSVAVISKTFFGREVALPKLLDPMNGDAVKLLILSVVIGFVQILAALAAKFVTSWKNGDKVGAFCDSAIWMFTLLGLGVLALGLVAGPVFVKIGGGMAIAGAVGLVLTQGRGNKGIVMKAVGGLAALYDITGYVSDLLSFSRLMALGLTTAAMASVFNLLGSMAGNGVIGIILMVVMFIVGHALTFALNALGTYVHTLRLQYVELFSKFYEGGGKEFKSFAHKNKYVGLRLDEKESTL